MSSRIPFICPFGYLKSMAFGATKGHIILIMFTWANKCLTRRSIKDYTTASTPNPLSNFKVLSNNFQNTIRFGVELKFFNIFFVHIIECFSNLKFFIIFFQQVFLFQLQYLQTDLLYLLNDTKLRSAHMSYKYILSMYQKMVLLQ